MFLFYVGSEDCRKFVPCSEDERFCDDEQNFPDCSGTGLSCDCSGCHYDVDKDSSIGPDFDKQKFKGEWFSLSIIDIDYVEEYNE